MMNVALPPVGTPYAFPSDPPNTFDCWTLLTDLRQQMGLKTPLAGPGWAPESFGEHVATEIASGHWRRLEAFSDARDGDAVLFNAKHVGTLVGRVIAHATHSTGVVYTTQSAVRRRFPRCEVYRCLV